MPNKHSHWKLVTGIVVGAIILIILSIFFFSRNGNYKTIIVEKADLIRQVDLTGEVVPVDEVDLSFTSGGKINNIFVTEGDVVNKGDVLIQLDDSEIQANLREAMASRELRGAELEALTGGSQIAGQYESVRAESVSLVNKALSVADNQIKTNIDSLYTDPQKSKPEITVSINNYLTRQKLNQERFSMGNTLGEWRDFAFQVNTEGLSESDLDITINYLIGLRDFVENLSDALSSAEPSGSVTASDISGFRTNLNNARTSIDSVIGEIIAIKEKLRATLSDIPVKKAQISSSQAIIERYEALTDEYVITAPFDGVVADVPVTNGEIVALNQIVVSLISDAGLEVEVFIPEVQIADVDKEDKATITFDAFGNDLSVGASIIHIDSRATEKDGIPTYKTILELDETSESLRAGMTANISIESLRIPNVIIIPQASVIRDQGIVSVEVLEDGDLVMRSVQLGRTDASGGIEVISGIEVSEELIISKD
ncbi:HlyD family efflux transporter periplasmic adaptor subunit [Candidatus Pacebacteria bacterium]|nr:HlyD family efflux transporter periplasmic adaptor subunit [Candidatus Paceibacterota bacterium]